MDEEYDVRLSNAITMLNNLVLIWIIGDRLGNWTHRVYFVRVAVSRRKESTPYG